MSRSEDGLGQTNESHFFATDKFAACRQALAGSIAGDVIVEPRLIGWTPNAAHLIFIQATDSGHRLLIHHGASGQTKEILSEAQWSTALPSVDQPQAEWWIDAAGEAVYRRHDGQVVRIAVQTGEVQLASVVPQRPPANGFPLLMAAPGEALLSPDGRKSLHLVQHNLLVRDLRQHSSQQSPDLLQTDDGIDEYAYGTPLYFGLQVQTDGSIARPIVAVWSPDSRFVLSYRLDYRNTHRRSLLRAVADIDGFPVQEQLLRWPEVMTGQTEHVPRAELWLFDTVTGSRYRIEGPQFDIYDADYASEFFLRQVVWAADSSALYLLPWARGRKSVALYRVDASDGSTQLLHQESSATLIDFMFCQDKFYLSATQQLFWISEQSGWAHIYLLSTRPDNPGLRHITSGAWAVRGIVHVDDARQWLYFVAGGREPGIDPYYRQLYRIRFDGSDLQRLTPENADHDIRFAPDGSHFADSFSRVDLPAEVVLRHADGTLMHRLGSADFSRAIAAGWQAPQAFSVKARDAETDLHGIMVRPKSFDARKSYPIILAIYPGCHTFSVPKRLELQARQMFFMQALAELGFVVARVDGMGGPGRSKAFHDVCYQNLQDATLPDQITAVRQLARRHPYIDIERVGIFGSSAGGYATARALLAYPEFFKVGVALAGNHDLLIEGAEWTEDYGGWPLDRQRLLEQSNSPLAARLQGRLLLIHGALDDNVSPAQSLRLAEALMKANKQVDMLIVPNADHAAFYEAQVQQHIWQYFDNYLK